MTKAQYQANLARGLTIQPQQINTLTRAEAYDIGKALQKFTNAKLREIKKFAPEGTPATRTLLEGVGQRTKGQAGSKSLVLSKDVSLNELRRFIRKTQTFNDPGRTKLNTVEKSREYEQKLYDRLEGYEYLSTKQRIAFWDLYSDLLDARPGLGERAGTARYGSDWAQMLVLEMRHAKLSDIVKSVDEMKELGITTAEDIRGYLDNVE